MADAVRRELEAVREWKIIGIALATAAGAMELKILAENPALKEMKRGNQL